MKETQIMTKHKMAQNVIKNALVKKGVACEYICKKLGIKLNNFLLCLDGKRTFSASEFLSLCVYLNLNLEDFKECSL